ncbi:DNA topoisomerase III [Proteinivorax hydrogeniformans]|uniref:DNA topoisomerase 3 n=1 Tax=Proteinivorax hydrogeniformans TaxID=1826727 RepID=A0AAU8HSX1_9FIRM
MGKKLVLAEKPSVGKDIAKVLNCNKKGNGFYEGVNHIVTWALGHLVTLAEPEQYGEQYKSWSMEHLPMLFDPLKLVVIKQSGKQYSVVKTQMSRKDVDSIIIATDAGREGELVARWIIAKARVKKPIKRLWISSVTDKAIRDGFNNLKDGKQYQNLYNSAQARAEADWYVGINATRALTCKYNAQLSCGRVQTPTLAMIAKREAEINSFTPKNYFGIKITAQGIDFTWHDNKSKDGRIFDESKTEKIIDSLKGQKLNINEVKTEDKKSYAPPFYDLTELQRDANKIFGFSAKETLSITQKLYEQHKVLTYPRTDSKYITTDMIDTLKDRVKACSALEHSSVANKLLQENLNVGKHFVDNKKVSDHHAIIPTEQRPMVSSLSDKEKKIYSLVTARFLAVLLPPFKYQQISVIGSVKGHSFHAKGKKITSKGWKVVLDRQNDDTVDTVNLNNIRQGQEADISAVAKTSGQTSPPALFNEGSLLAAMENPKKYMDKKSKDLQKVIGETGGIGTVATRADIIEKLFGSFLIEKQGKDINITSKGKQLLELVPEDLKSPTLTAQWEQKLTAISKGSLKKEEFLKDIKNYTVEVIREIENSQQKFTHDNLTRSRCPKCNKFMLEVNGKKGKMLICQDRECGGRENVAKTTNARCPECKKKLELRGQKGAEVFVCKCGHKEKMSSFNKRKGKQNQKVNKRDVAKYLKKQDKKDEPLNTALADALAKLKK